MSIINLNDTTPVAPVGGTNVNWQWVLAGGGLTRNVSAYVPKIGFGGTEVKTGDYTAVAADIGFLIAFDTSTPATFTLPSAPPSAQWIIAASNFGPNPISVVVGVPISGPTPTIDGGLLSAPDLNPGEGIFVFTDGTNYFTIRCSKPRFADSEVPSGTMDGVNQTFTLLNTPNPATSLELLYNGVLQNEGVSFTLVGNSITFLLSFPDLSQGEWLLAWYRY